MNITEFLLQRIIEDEAQVEKHLPELSSHGLGSYGRRVIAECAAKRAIIEDHKQDWAGPVCTRCRFVGGWVEYPCKTMASLAAVYKDHPDYQQEWATKHAPHN